MGKDSDKVSEQTATGNDPNSELVSSAVGKKLKNMYDQIANEPVPDRFKDLLDQLSKQTDK